jgi:hypothetical protein
MFANDYFRKYGNYIPLISNQIPEDLQLFVMIPCFREPAILETLRSLSECDLPEGTTEVFTIINEPENCDQTISDFNLQTFREVKEWSENHSTGKIRFYTLPPVKLPQKWAGVGMARKRGMDEGLWRFNRLNHKKGIIVSLDADTLADRNYFTAIAEHFSGNPLHVGATIAFSHQLEGLSEKQRQGILLYEKYLKYYKEALTYSGYPTALFTVGSAFAVRAEAYLKRGGMTRRKAGEDFYFLQTLTQLGRVGEINETSVHPSSRVSDRVPFGTGPAMKQWMEGTVDLHYTYNIQAFADLKQLFSIHKQLYSIQPEEYTILVQHLPAPVADFLESDEFWEKIVSLRNNCSDSDTFSERFFHLFNAFRVLKFINFSHGRYYRKQRLEEAHQMLQQYMGENLP